MVRSYMVKKRHLRDETKQLISRWRRVRMNKRIDVSLSDEEMRFLTWLAKRDDLTIQEEMRQIFYTGLGELQEYMAKEFGYDQ